MTGNYLDRKGAIVESDKLDLDRILDSIMSGSKADQIGSLLTFTGVLRSTSSGAGKKVVGMEIEAWPERGDRILTQIAEEIIEKHRLVDCRIYHAHGLFKVGETLVIVAVASSHRRESLIAIEEAIDRYKHESPVWKKEIYDDGTSTWITESPN